MDVPSKGQSLDVPRVSDKYIRVDSGSDSGEGKKSELNRFNRKQLVKQENK